MRRLPNKFKYQGMCLLLLYIMGVSVNGQSQSTSHDCATIQLEVYADSLTNLLLAYHPMEVLQISDSLFQKYGSLNCSVIVRMKSSKANAYELLYNFEAALEIYNDILKIAIKNQSIEDEIAIRLSLARVHETISRPKLCIENLDKAKELMDKHGFVRQLSRYYIRYSSYQRIYKNKALAKEFAAKAITLGQEHGVARSVADGHLLMGLMTEEFEEAVQHAQESSKLFFELGDYVGGMSQQMNAAKMYLRRDEYDKALEIVNIVKVYANGITNNDKVFYQFKRRIAKVKADVFERTGDKDKLITSLKNYNEYSELIGFIVNQEHINQLLIENAVSQEKEKVETANKQNKLLLIGLLCFGGIILLLSRLYMLNAAKKDKIQEQTLTITKQYDELEKLYNYQSTLLSEVHHRIKNNLQLIISLLTLQKARLTDDTHAGMLDMLCHRINSIALIHEQLYNSKEFDKVDVGLYSSNLLGKFLSLLSEKNIAIDYEVNNIQLNLDTITPLGLIWSELISNSLKYNQNKEDLKVYFDLVKNEDHYLMHYYDNGQGYPNGHFSANKAGMGFTIIHSLSRQLFAKSNAYNSNGAHFTLTFKEKIISPL